MKRREFGKSAVAVSVMATGVMATGGLAGCTQADQTQGVASGLDIPAYRTPDARFADLPGYAFAPNYVDGLPGYGDLRMHYVDVGPRAADHTFLCLHGQPSWSYLYRKMIPVFVASGARVVAPDWFGFGRSDKPTDDATYSFTFHREAMMRFIERMDLHNVTLVCQDWGGVLGLTIPMDMSERFSRLLVMNTDIAVGNAMPPGFALWQQRAAGDLDLVEFFGQAVPILSAAELAAYAAPFPVYEAKAGVRTFPSLVPEAPDAPGAAIGRRALAWWQNDWSGTAFSAVGAQDRLLGVPVMERLSANIRNCPPPLVIPDGGHFVQEWGEPIAEAALAHFASA